MKGLRATLLFRGQKSLKVFQYSGYKPFER